MTVPAAQRAQLIHRVADTERASYMGPAMRLASTEPTVVMV